MFDDMYDNYQMRISYKFSMDLTFVLKPLYVLNCGESSISICIILIYRVLVLHLYTLMCTCHTYCFYYYYMVAIGMIVPYTSKTFI